MKKKKEKLRNEQGAYFTRFRLSTTAGNPLPLETIQQRLLGLWQSLTWPICLKILKANLALTIALGLYFVNPIRQYTGTSGILAAVAVEFVHPSKSYGFLAEDVLIGSIMCCLSAAWSILGTYLSSLVRSGEDATLAQPRVCVILIFFLIMGSFLISIVRIKVEKANVGGMLAATIMVLSLTTAVSNIQFTALPTLRALSSTLIGFALVFFVFLFIFPENSTCIYVEQLIKVLEEFDRITQHQVNRFLQIEGKVDSVALIHKQLDTLVTNLIEKKRTVQREPSYNVISPTDVNELTSLVKQLHVPLKGLGITRAMEENMRCAEEKMMERQDEDEINLGERIERPRSYYGGTDDEEEMTCIVEEFIEEEERSSSESTVDPIQEMKQRKLQWEDSIKVMTYWKDDYDDVIHIVRPTYLHLTLACSVAVKESIQRLRRMQSIDPRYQERPLLYKYYYLWKVGKKQEREEYKAFEYDSQHDPSVPLYEAIQHFHRHRLVGLNRLYTASGVPRRILLLLLTFQFNLHTFAKLLYTLTSLVYELDQARSRKKWWWPHMSFRKWLFQNHPTEESFELETPAAIEDVTNPLSIQKDLTRRASEIAVSAVTHRQSNIDLESQKVDDSLYKLDTPYRGCVRTSSEYRRRLSHQESLWPQNTFDPMDYHDPDVAYPTTRLQWMFYKLYQTLFRHIYTAEAAFAFRAILVVVGLSLPAFLEQSVRWYAQTNAQWAVVVALIWMGPSVGRCDSTMTRTVGTFIGAVQSIIIWEIAGGRVPGLVVLSFITNLPWLLVYIHGKFWKAGGLFALITTSLVLGYTYDKDPYNIHKTIFVIAYQRTVTCLVGVLAALIISIFPYPKTGRVELRHRISKTISELGSLYSTFLTLLVRDTPEDKAHRRVDRKLFQKVAFGIRQQIKGERVLLEQSRFEPTLRGVFPEDRYVQLLQVLENILSLVISMEFVVQRIPFEWRMMIVKDTWKARKQMIASYLTALHLGSDALTNKSPLPPYVIRPTKARRVLTNMARKLKLFEMQNLGEREYTYYSTYMMNSEQLAVELELLVATVRGLVGPDSVSIWLNYKH
ncbi:hypothetical protein G6F22_007172 [Rhizopus arrhizus]|nr:hypothetical protein G6F22_007172 [Rhizopus arrhizus]